MNRIIIIAVMLFLCPLQGSGASYKDNWTRATNYYMQKQYDSAVYYFEKVAASKPQNEEVYYNLGNSYYRLNRIAPAVLNYQRALRVNPSYRNAQDNLAITQARINHNIPATEDIFFIVWWKDLTAQTMANSWAIAALIAFLLIIATLWIRKYNRGLTWLPVQVPGIFGFIAACFFLFSFVAAGRSQGSAGAVVTEGDAPLMNNQQKGKPLALIPEGTTVQVAGEKGMWVEVVLPDGRTGWLLQVQIAKI